MMNTAKKAYDEEDFGEALRLYQEIQKREPDNTDAFQGLARCYYKLRKLEEAIASCDQALAIDYSLAWPHLIKSYVYFLMNKIDLCKEEARIAIEVDPSNWEMNYWWGSVLVSEGQTDEGLAFLEKAVSMQINYWPLYNSLSTAYAKKKDVKRYFNVLKEMNRLKPNPLLFIGMQLGNLARYGVWVLLVHYGLIVFSLIIGQQFILIIPAVISVLWIASGGLALFQNRNAGLFWILLGIINGSAVVGAFLLLH